MKDFIRWLRIAFMGPDYARFASRETMVDDVDGL